MNGMGVGVPDTHEAMSLYGPMWAHGTYGPYGPMGTYGPLPYGFYGPLAHSCTAPQHISALVVIQRLVCLPAVAEVLSRSRGSDAAVAEAPPQSRKRRRSELVSNI